MKLSSPAFERQLRRQVRQEIRQSRLLWKDYRQHKARWWRRNRNLGLGIGSIYLLVILFLVVVRSGRPLAVLTVIALYASGTALFRCTKHFTGCTTGFDRAVLTTLPISDSEFVTHESKILVRSWLGALAIFGLAYGTYAAVYGIFWRDLPAVLAASILQALTGLALGSAVIGLKPKPVGASFVMPFYGLMLLCIFYLPDELLRLLWPAILVTPAGWVAHGFAGVVGSDARSERFWLIPAFIFSAMVPFTLRALRSRILSAVASPDYAFDRVFIPRPDDADATEEYLATKEPANESQVAALERPFAEESKKIDWVHLGWILRIVAAVLNAREKIIAEFMLGNDLHRWSKAWRSATVITLIGAVLTLSNPALPSWIFFLPMIVAAFMSAPILGGAWVGFKGPLTSGFILPAYSVFPLSYREISWVMLKINYVRILTWAPLAVAYASALGYRLNHSFMAGAAIGIDIVCIVVALQPVIVAGHFSSGTNDTKQISWPRVLFFTFALGLLVIMLIAGFTIFIVPTFWVQVGAIGVISGASALGWLGYKQLFERGGIDLLSRPR